MAEAGRMRINVFYFILLLFMASIAVASVFEPLRYLKYILPVVPILLFKFTNHKDYDKTLANYYFTLLGFYAIVISYLLLKDVIQLDVSARFIPNVVFIFGPLLFIAFAVPYFRYEQRHRYVMAIFWISIAVFIYEDFFDLLSVVANIAQLQSAILSSRILTESHLGYTFGFLVLYTFVEKYPWKYRLLALLMLVLCFKRIALGATVVTLAISFALAFSKLNLARNRIFWAFFGLLANVAYIKITQLIVARTFDEAVQKYTGFSTDRFLMGRQQFYTEAFEKVGNINWFGVGVGKIDDIMIKFYGLDSGISMRLHSEILKNYFEFGAILFAVWIFLLYYKTIVSNKAALFLIYFNILCLTDNAFIYFDVMFYFYFFILIFFAEVKQKENALKSLQHG